MLRRRASGVEASSLCVLLVLLIMWVKVVQKFVDANETNIWFTEPVNFRHSSDCKRRLIQIPGSETVAFTLHPISKRYFEYAFIKFAIDIPKHQVQIIVST